MSTMNQTNIYFSIVPKSYSSLALGSGGNTYDVYGAGSNTPLRSVNSPITLQVLWLNSTSTLSQYDEGTGATGERIEGDLVNVLFDIYESSNYVASPAIATDFRKICTIKKPKDVPMTWNGRPDDEEALLGHRFTINISEVLADLLSYSLVPVNVGTWGCINDGTTGPNAENGSQSTFVNQFGGMNGQWVQSNVASVTANQNRYNLSANGCDRRIKVVARFEILAADGTLEISTSPATITMPDFWISNAAPQWGERHDLQNRVMSENAATSDGPYFFTNCPNSSNGSDINEIYFKKIRLEDEAEYLQWFQSSVEVSGGNHIDGIGIAVDYDNDPSFGSYDTVYLTDCTAENRIRLDGLNVDDKQFRQFVQNVSPAYINQHNNGIQPDYGLWSYVASPITTSVKYYRCYVYSIQSNAVVTRHSVYQYYELDTETKGPWKDVCGMKEGVKFMWLNRLGGIDSYVAKRIFTKSVEVNRNTITKKAPDRLHTQDILSTGTPFNNNIGANMYPHSREVLNVDANRMFSATTDPLTTSEANWLEELLTSPNVWVIQENDGSKYLEGRAGSDELRPSTKGYLPILITNSDSVLIDESQGLVQLTIDFIESHKINTQRN